MAKTGTQTISRRALLKAVATGGVMSTLGAGAAAVAATGAVEWVSSTRGAPWRRPARAPTVGTFENFLKMDVMLLEDTRFQTIEGFGACFNEVGWLALQRLPSAARDAVMRELFAPGAGLNLNLCRLPIGANDFARSWYSYNETAGDFAMDHFDLSRDDQMQVPFIRAAQRQRPDLKLWASPWSPPTWMKQNGHYAMVPSFPWAPPNGLKPQQVGASGKDMFIQEARYFEAYALYFRKFVEGYAQRGIKISAVMPQNEFNSAQPFPSCCWTPEGLARFIPYLGRQMDDVGVELFFGTLERGDPAMFEAVLAQPEAARYIKGIGVQWAGRRAIPFIHQAHPDLRVYQSEQECGDGKNDWRFARYTWTLMKDFLRAGASAYLYWNIATPNGGVSTWGWAQNALLCVDMATGRHTVNPDFHVFKHLSHYVRPGAQRIDTLSISGFENLLAFRNPDGRIVVIVHNDMNEPQPLRIAIGTGKLVSATLPADSFNTLVI
ncbi:beta-glycosidase [Duganella sp. FT94W]|uniref:Beta-glycosidase n=1 Tax=Duganella lactea TaxID=2692173 RepID=A0ABW9V6E5_9BURK|nr:glycoside hydrolase family 30 protein [Duganella lactea]MYM35234.1 beta-glycosidase [Duganella lactea]